MNKLVLDKQVLIEPTFSVRPFGPNVVVFMFGRPNCFLHIRRSLDLMNAVVQRVKLLDVKTIYAPDVRGFNAEVIDPEEVDCPRTINYDSVEINSDYPVDGVVLRRPSAMFIPTSDCHTIIIRAANGDVVAAHAGRWSLLDKAVVYQSGKKRDQPSVVHSALNYLEGDRASMKSAIVCGIGPKHFCHPVSEPKNRKLVQYVVENCGPTCVDSPEELGQINLPEVFRTLVQDQGLPVGPESFSHDKIDTFDDRTTDGQLRWNSFQRDKAKAGHNGILVIRLK